MSDDFEIITETEHNYNDIVKILLKYCDNPYIYEDGHNPLMYETIDNNKEAVENLLKCGVNPNITDYCRQTPLFIASSYNHTEIIKLLLQYNADVNIREKNGNTPLMMASAHNNMDIVKLLLERGADVNIRNNFGNNALSWSMYYRENVEIVELLLEHNIEINIKNNNGNTPLITASDISYKNIVKLLLEHGADPNIKNNSGKTAINYANSEIRELLIQYGADGRGCFQKLYDNLFNKKYEEYELVSKNS